MHKTCSDKKGYTLIEIALAVFVISLLGAAVIAFARTTIKNSSMFQTSITTKSQVRKVFKEFTEEVRGGYYAWNGTHVIEVASSTSFTFYSNIDSDKYTEKINYSLNGDKIIRQTVKYNINTSRYDFGTTTKTVVVNVVNSTTTPIFKYYDSGYDGTDGYASLQDPVELAKIRLVDFTIMTNDTGKRNKTIEFYDVKVSLRNLKDNY